MTEPVSTITFGFWKRLQVRILGKRYVDYAGQYVLEAYLYKGVWYVTKYQSIYL